MHSVRDFGAVGDGKTKDTAAVQRAIDAGGMVHFPPGTYCCGTLYLRSNGGLDLAPGAVLLASPDREDYNPDDFIPQNLVFHSECVSGAHFLVAVEVHNLVIRGGGRIDGNRQAFYNPPVERRDIWSQHIAWRPGQMLYLVESENITIADVELFNAPYWTCFLHGCEKVTIHGLRIYNHPFTRNGDGIDLDCCRFVTVSDCIIDVGDDCIALRGNPGPLKKPRDCEYITITNCILKTICNAFRIGVGTGAIRACQIANCIIHESRNAVCICSKYSPTQGVLIEDIAFENLRIEAAKPLAIVTNAQGKHLGASLQPIRRISFHHLRGTASISSVIHAHAPGDIEDIQLSDVIFRYSGGANIDRDPAADFCEFSETSAPAAFWCENIVGLDLHRVRIDWLTRDPGWQAEVIARDCAGVHTSDCTFLRGLCEE